MRLRNGLGALLLSAVFGITAAAFVTSWSTYLGSSGVDAITAIAVDRSGNIYVAGWTDSPDLPTTGATGWGRGGGVDAFVAKWTQHGATLAFCRYIGGSASDRAYGLAVDNSGNIYITGGTTSTDFPTVNPFQSHSGGGQDAFIAKLDSWGNLVYSTYLGGSGTDTGYGIAVDNNGRAFIAGETTSNQFPLAGALQNSYRNQYDAFVTVFSSSGDQLVYSTYLGGMGDDHGRAIAIDSSGNAYVTGDTTSTDFPTVNPLQSSPGGGQDAFVAKISPDGRSLIYSTYLGGSGGAFESGAGIAVDPSGNAYVTGTTQSSNFPIANALQPVLKGLFNGFLSKLNAAGSGLVYSTYLGGSSTNFNTAVAIDSSGNAFVAGYTASSDFPNISTVQSGQAGGYDAFLVKVSADGKSVLDGTFLGGSQTDAANAVAVDSTGAAYVAGQTLSTDFPLKNAAQTMNAGTIDGFVTIMTPQPQYNGYHDSATCTALTGWAWDATNPNSPVSVDILDGTSLLVSIGADQFRQDLLNIGIGNGYHGFNYPFPPALRDGRTHSIWVRISGSTINLIGTPKSVVCGLYQGYHDTATCTLVAGWAWDRGDPNNPINIDVLDGTSLLATLTANQFRQDLFNIGIGNGYHGIAYVPPLAMKDGQTHSIRIRVSPSGPDLQNTPRTVACPKPVGYLDVASCTLIAGWTWNSTSPNQPVTVDFIDGTTVFATVPVNQFRQDLYNIGIGNGYHGFSYVPGANLRDGLSHTIHVRFSNTAVDLFQSPRVVTCAVLP